MSYSFCSRDFKQQPYWREHTPLPQRSAKDLPQQTEVLVIGSGYTGLHCALQTAIAGRQTTVIEAEAAGWGCSTRNGGQISGEIKPDFPALSRRYGSEMAYRLLREARGALDWLGDFIAEQAIDCDFRRNGRFLAAHSPRQFRRLVASAQNQPRGLEQPLRIVHPGDQHTEIDSDYYHGGLVIERHCSLDPAGYHAGLMQRATEAGTDLIDYCRAIAIEPVAGGFRVTTSRGEIRTRDLVIATNGYTQAVTAWQRRRVIPIGSYMLATEPMPLAQAEKLMPGDRVFSDTRKIVVYFRRSPDGRSLLFGGRVSVFESDPVKSLPALRQEMLRIFPQLEGLKISHTWMGFVGYTFDSLPHLGVHNGMHYAMGYCGSGICLASFLGHRLGLQLLGDRKAYCAFNDPVFQTRPLYSGKPWFLGASVRYYQLRDRLF